MSISFSFILHFSGKFVNLDAEGDVLMRNLLLVLCAILILSACAQSPDLSSEIEYYEQMCENLELLSYDDVYNPEKWRFYHEEDTEIYHQDWLCTQFNRDEEYVIMTKSTVEAYDYSPCDQCKSMKDYFFLDTETGIFHSDKDCLDLSTSDYKHANHIYRFVSKSSAKSNGYMPCEKCL